MSKTKLIRDEKTQAILNVDNNALEAYKKRKNINIQNNERIKTLEEKLDNLIKLMEKLTNA